mmetsp:Transcript_40719/g.86689  ORF Transcript_40719/g.86689 Transcript_40719/m.86689 type:complete len:222 (-) Transcript_40719:681-1346(-)
MRSRPRSVVFLTMCDEFSEPQLCKRIGMGKKQRFQSGIATSLFMSSSSTICTGWRASFAKGIGSSRRVKLSSTVTEDRSALAFLDKVRSLNELLQAMTISKKRAPTLGGFSFFSCTSSTAPIIGSLPPARGLLLVKPDVLEPSLANLFSRSCVMPPRYNLRLHEPSDTEASGTMAVPRWSPLVSASSPSSLSKMSMRSSTGSSSALHFILKASFQTGSRES